MTLLDPLPLRHEKVLERGMTNLKKYVDSTLDEWKYTGTKNNVRLYSRKPEIPQTPMIYRGDYHFAADPTMVEHVRPVDLSSAFVSQSIRKVGRWFSPRLPNSCSEPSFFLFYHSRCSNRVTRGTSDSIEV